MDARLDALEVVGPLIRAKARRLARCPCFYGDDLEDIEQDLRFAAVKGLAGYRKDRGLSAHLLSRVIRNEAATLARNRNAMKRMPAAARVSLDSVTGDQVDKTLGDQIHRRSPAEQMDLVLDLETAVASLPIPQQDLCARLERQTIAEISRETGMARSTVSGHVRKLRQRFEDWGLRDYLSVAPSFRRATE